MGNEQKVGPKKAAVLDDLHEVISMVAFMDFSTRRIFAAGDSPNDFIINGIACINSNIEARLNSIAGRIDESSVFTGDI